MGMHPDFAQPYGEVRAARGGRLLAELNALVEHHRTACEPYARILAAFAGRMPAGALEEIPYLPASIFKKLDLRSVGNGQVVRVLRSSGTASSGPSRIALDKVTADRQSRALAAIVMDFIGPARRPMLLIARPPGRKTGDELVASEVAALGFSRFGRDHRYVLDESGTIDARGVAEFAEKHHESGILLFGFTHPVWEFVQAVSASSGRLDLGADSVLIHGGGWKRMEEHKVSNEVFKKTILERLGIRRVHNYYGMVEQVGSIFMECERGRLHAPAFAAVIVRDPQALTCVPRGELGLLQVMSTIPFSYPGFSVLTDDVGRILGEDDCECGRNGVTFSVEGRAPQAELRGCSDTGLGAAA